MLIILSGDHLVSAVLDLTVDTLNTPLSMPMRCSPDLTSHPSHIPSLHLSSNLPGISLVLGMRKCTSSPNSASLPFGRRPFIICSAVRPLGRMTHRVMRYPAFRISHGVTACLRVILVFSFSSSADRIVLHCPSTSWIARSMVPLLSESPTRELSNAVPNRPPRFKAICFGTSMMAGSWSS